MSFKMTKCSCVIVGTFNIYIFQPPWVAKILRLPENEQLHWQTDLSRPGFKILCNKSKNEIVVRPDRVILTSNELSDELVYAAEQIVKRLPETPLEAMGLNIEFEIPPLSFKSELQTQFFSQTIVKCGEVQQLLAAKCDMESKVMNLSGSKKENSDVVVVSSNMHYDVKDKTIDERIKIIHSFNDEIPMVRECVEELWFKGEQS